MADYVMTAEQFIDKLKLAVDSKTLYCNSAFGAPCGYGNNRTRYARNQSAARKRKIMDADPDCFLFDCVCLIKGILWGWDADPNAIYGGADYCANGVPDMTINAITAQCSDYSSYIWDNIVPGEWLHLDGEHCGIAIGDGLAIECTPSWQDKVQITAIGNIGEVAGYPTRSWTGHGKLPWVDYGSQPTPPTPPQPRVAEDGWWGTETTFALQEILGCQSLDGIVSRQPNGNRKYLANASASSWEFKGWPFYLGGSAVIKALQQRIGADVDGYFGRGSVTALQQYLKDRGYYAGLVDGSMGPATVSGLQMWINAQ